MNVKKKPSSWTTVKLPKKGERVVREKRVWEVVAVKRGRVKTQETG